MVQIKVALLQQPGSPLIGTLAPILAGCEVATLSPESEAPLPPKVAGGEMLVLWDLHGFSDHERRRWQKRLEAEKVGVVLAAPPGLAGLAELATACGALALITPSQGAPQSRLQLAAASAMQERMRELLSQAAQLEAKLSERAAIEKAKNLLILSMGLSEPEAMRRLQKHARRTNQKLIKVAQQVLATYHLFNGDKT
ncbi:MAG: ANTAR domain-containing protein [Desulfarculaceae bacterium]|nr:ANTAR domain-containing protein [Desulfarculaceae bacterium]MCF8048554.1 ANTAR domain-containing protein [Desulfarculaceae bacterium]MCF8099240.1 ANTAR domain-containing protein [Desulfarculaceae bacterium]MCF8124182.1 ANTAR domain-containing protein [Desulfarculaceae bacterium]